MGTGAQIEITSFVLSLIIFCASTVVFGRFFCGFACTFRSLSDWMPVAYVLACKKIKKKPVTLGISPWDVFSMLHAGNFALEGYFAGVVLLILIL